MKVFFIPTPTLDHVTVHQVYRKKKKIGSETVSTMSTDEQKLLHTNLCFRLSKRYVYLIRSSVNMTGI